MSALVRSRRKRRPRYPRPTVRLHVETLEPRSLPAAPSWAGLLHPVAAAEPNDTLDRAQDLGQISLTSRAEVVGTIGQGAAGAADVDWYQFELTAPTDVHLATLDAQGGSSLVSVLSLYNNDLLPAGASDPYTDAFDPLHHRLLAQDDGAAHGGDASLDRLLGPGTYYVAVSGSGDRYFNPFLAGSGNNGSTGDYGLLLTATAAGVSAGDGPAVLTADPAPGSTLAQSPFVLRLDLSEALKASSIISGRTVKLVANPNGTFGDGHDYNVRLAAVQFSAAANELQIIPKTPLGPGYYKVYLAGYSGLPRMPFLVDAAGNPLGKTASSPQGADYSLTFQVNGIDGVAGATKADDTLGTARQLQDITDAGLVRVSGALGIDPTDPQKTFNAQAVDLYHFQLHGAGQFAFSAEVFAGRIGSPLVPAVTLFQRDDQGTLHLIGTNNGSFNPTVASDGVSTPLLNDPLFFAGLQAGDYYLAVSSSGNTPDTSQPLSAWQAGPQANGSFDPTHSHSTTMPIYSSAGPYVLNLAVQADNTAPTVVTPALADGTTLAVPPTEFAVQFSKPVLLAQLASEDFYLPGQTPNSVPAVFIEGTTDDGTAFGPYYPQFQSFEATTNRATFLMRDAVPNGVYRLHLSGALGLTDFAGNPLVGSDANDPSGDYVTQFTVHDPARGTQGNIQNWTGQEPNDDAHHPQAIGPLFPTELGFVGTDPNTGNPQDGVEFSGTITPSPDGDNADYYQIRLFQSQVYLFNLTGDGVPAGALTLTDADGNVIPLDTSGAIPQVTLNPGTYTVGVSWTSTSETDPVSYQLQISAGMSPESPAPLAVGPAPAYRISLAPPPPPVQSPPTTPPGSNTPPPNSNTPPTDSQPPAQSPPSNGDNPPGTNPPTTPPPTTSTPPADSQPPANTPPSSGSTPPATNPPPTTPPSTNPPPANNPPAANPPAADTPPPGNLPTTPPANNPPANPPAAPPPVVNAPIPGPVANPTPAPSGNPGSSPDAPAAPVAPPRISLPVPASGGSETGVSADVLAALRAVPVGGVRGPTAVDGAATPDRVALHHPDTAPPDFPVRFIIRTQPAPTPPALSGTEAPPAEGQDPAGQNPADPSGNSGTKTAPRANPQWLNLWKRLLDEFFRTNWSGRLFQDVFQSLPLLNQGFDLANPTGMAEDHLAGEELGAALTVPARADGLAGPALSWVAAAAVLPTLGLMARPDDDKTRRPRLAVRPPAKPPQ